MKTFLAILLTIGLFFNGQAQSPEKSKLVQVAGTKVTMQPPTGFKKAEGFFGFQKDDAVINIMDLAGGNFYSNTQTFNRAAFTGQGITVFDYQETEINGFSCKFIHIKGDNGTKSYNLVFGDSTFSVMMIAVYPAQDDAKGKELKKALFTATYDKTLAVDPFATAIFSVDDTASSFKYSQAASNMFIYTLGGKTENLKGEPIVLIIPLPADKNSTAESTCEEMVDGLANQGLKNLVIESNAALTTNGYDGYEILVSGVMKEKPTFILVQVLVNGEKQAVVQGIMNGGFQNIEDIRKLSATLTFN